MALDGSLAKTNTSVQKNTSKVFNNGDKKPGKLGGMIDSVSGIQNNVAGTAVGLGNIVAKVSGGNSKLTGKTKAKYKSVKETSFLGGLMGFYSHFGGGSEINSIDRIDPFSTFECEFKFFPSITGVQDVTKKEKKKINEETLETETKTEDVNVAQTEIKEDSTLAKILKEIQFKESILEISSNKKSDTEIDDSREDAVIGDSKIDEEDGRRYHTEEQIYHVERDVTDIEINLGIYIQRIVIPNIQIEGGEDVTTLIGKFPVPGNLVIPDNNTFSMEVVNVESPVIENIFYPWMRETTLPKWSYEGQPYTTARITIDFTEHANVVYYFYGCRPTQIQLIHPDQSQTSNLTRSVTFAFDFMTVQTVSTTPTIKETDKKKKGGKDKGGYGKTDMANAALFSAANTLKL